MLNEPNHDNIIDTHSLSRKKNETDDYNSQRGKTCSQSIVGKLSRHKRRDKLSDQLNQIINR